jgi:hypothetical protein
MAARVQEQRAFDAGKEVMDVLRSGCAQLAWTLESMLQASWGWPGTGLQLLLCERQSSAGTAG